MKLPKGVETAGGGSWKQRRSVRHMNPAWLENYWSNKGIKCFVCQSNNAPTYHRVVTHEIEGSRLETDSL